MSDTFPPNGSDIKILPGHYSSVQEMVDAECNHEFAGQFRQYQAERNLIRAFRIVGDTVGISDEELANRLGWQLDDVADFYAMDDGKITLHELSAVATALKLSVTHRFEAMDDSPEAQAAMDAFEAATQGKCS